MSVESVNEAAKVVVETSGSWGWFGAVLAAIGTGVVGVWRAMTKRVSQIEREAALALVIKEDLNAHIKAEDRKFNAIYTKLHSVGEDVAWIKGKMDQ